MRQELEEKIFALKPEWFETLQYGIECGDGWFDLVHSLVEKLVHLYESEPKSFIGFSVAQVKEKFGGLRFYVNYGENPDSIIRRVTSLISLSEKFSFSVCEECGEQARCRTLGYVQTLCRYPHD